MAAPKGNKFALGNFGTSKKWESVELLQKDIDNYFIECDKNKAVVYDAMMKRHIIEEPTPYSTEGLCDVLDCDRKTLLNYEKKEGYEDYFHTIKKAKRKIQRNKVERGHTGKSKTAMVIFDLKNNDDYKDKTEQEITIPTGDVIIKSIGKEID
tara:strand:+ start:99 stop:557 length:459 start_codon:yes stop_codon:yes gene_type:complete